MGTFAYFYLDDKGQQQGPAEAAQLTSCGVNAATLVWRSGMKDWVPAGTLPELNGFVAPAPPRGGASAASEPPRQEARTLPPCPPTHLVWAILVTVCCCLPFGIVAIVKASNVSSLYDRGDYDRALLASDEAKKWVILSLVFGLISCCIGGGAQLLHTSF